LTFLSFRKTDVLDKVFKLAKIENKLPKEDVKCDDGSFRKPVLSLKKTDGLGLDGALKSKNLQIDQRIKFHNPHCISIHCACHSGQLCISRLHAEASRESHEMTDRQLTMMNLDGQSVQTWIDRGIEVSKKLHDITVASCQVDQIFKDAQQETGENNNFKGRKSVQIGGKPMFRWESCLFFCRKLVKLLESVVRMLEKMSALGLCNDPKHPIMYSVNYVIKKVKSADFWSNIGWQIDTLTPLVKFIVSNELSETDPESLLFSRETCLKELRRLVMNKTKPGTRGYQKLLDLVKAKEWKDCGDDWKEERLSKLYCKGTEMLIKNFQNLFNEETEEVLSMFSWLSLNTLRRECKTADDVETFKQSKIEETVNFFCEEKIYIPTFSNVDPVKTSGAPPALADPMVEDDAGLRSGIAQLLHYLFLNYLGVNKSSGKFWTVSEALKDMSTGNLSWFAPGTGVRRVVTFYRNLVPTSAELERLMSYFRLLDTPLTQARTPDTVSKMLMLLKDSPNPDQFDFDLAITIWKHLKLARKMAEQDQVLEAPTGRRFIYFPDPGTLPTPGRTTVKPFKDLLVERAKKREKKEALRKKLNSAGNEEFLTAVFEIEDLDDLDDLEEPLDTIEQLEEQELEVIDEFNI
jgi:hypothetical protein